MMNIPAAPAHLSAAMKGLWRDVNTAYEVPPEHLAVLRVTCEAFDRAQGARESIARLGMIVDGRRHPLIGVESKSTELFLRGIRDLGLEEELCHAAK